MHGVPSVFPNCSPSSGRIEELVCNVYKTGAVVSEVSESRPIWERLLELVQVHSFLVEQLERFPFAARVEVVE